MGRRAKYLTQEEAAAGHREQDRKYNATPHGQQVRAQAAQALHVQKSAKPTLYISGTLHLPPRRQNLDLPPLEPKIKQLHDMQLPNDALQGARGRDFSPLDMWREEPPFSANPDAEERQSLSYFSYTHHMKIALHGIRLREEREGEAQRCAAFGADREAAMGVLQEDLLELLETWARVDALSDFYHPSNESREYAMWCHYTQWLAHKIYRLYHLKFLL
ncbi:hypothetical protein K438DRAFT_1992265 [Mycena galopus ATCC 62051]|nr:hypothetical protein K438DRAFT_1992265 [Mycena galopus ATCC 62051]